MEVQYNSFNKEVVKEIIKLQRGECMGMLLDYIYNTLEDELLQDNFIKCDFFLSRLTDLSPFKTITLIGILTITLAWKGGLPARQYFYNQAELFIFERCSRRKATALLEGLK